jgi:CxxC motif-containing protein (DUF1111 family)
MGLVQLSQHLEAFRFAFAGNELGRFGWKANQPNLYQQSAAAYVNDIGVTNPLYQLENCHDNAVCDTLSDDPEITNEILESVELYVQTLAVPGRRNFDSNP